MGIFGAALVMMDGGRGLTGRAGGGAVGCGGEVVSEATEVPTGVQVSPVAAVHQRALAQLRPALVGSAPSLSFSPVQVPATGVQTSVSRYANLSPTLPKPTIPVTTVATGPSLVDAIEDAGATEYARLIRLSALDSILADASSSFTVFAPSDAAMAQLISEQPDLLDPAKSALFFDLLASHVVRGQIRRAKIATSTLETLVPGCPIQVTVSGGATILATASGASAKLDAVVESVAKNGVVMSADDVLMPSFPAWSLLRGAGFSYFVTMVEAAGQVDRFTSSDKPVTVLAPSDDAFLADGWDLIHIHDVTPEVLSELIDAHVIGGLHPTSVMRGDVFQSEDDKPVELLEDPSTGALLVDRAGGAATAEVVRPDLSADAGMVHGLDRMLVR